MTAIDRNDVWTKNSVKPGKKNMRFPPPAGEPPDEEQAPPPDPQRGARHPPGPARQGRQLGPRGARRGDALAHFIHSCLLSVERLSWKLG